MADQLTGEDLIEKAKAVALEFNDNRAYTALKSIRNLDEVTESKVNAYIAKLQNFKLDEEVMPQIATEIAGHIKYSGYSDANTAYSNALASNKDDVASTDALNYMVHKSVYLLNDMNVERTDKQLADLSSELKKMFQTDPLAVYLGIGRDGKNMDSNAQSPVDKSSKNFIR